VQVSFWRVHAGLSGGNSRSGTRGRQGLEQARTPVAGRVMPDVVPD